MALVVVLGLISLLLVSSVTFAIMMRVERASSANARNTIMARQAVKSALAYAIRDIDRNIGSNKWPLWRDSSDYDLPVWKVNSNPTLPFKKSSTSAADGRSIFFWKDTFGSIDHSIRNNEQQGRAVARVMGHELQDYLPFAIRHRAYAQRYGRSGNNPEMPELDRNASLAYTNAITPEWVPMTIVETNSDFRNFVVGRCAYLALNTSGYLEIPSLCREGDGKNANRRYGASPAEIQPVGDFLQKGDGDDLKSKNKGVGYETVAEIIRAKANENANPQDHKDNKTVFADGAAFTAFNFSPVGRMPTNLPGTDASFNDRLCIAGDGSDHHIECLRKHKAAIIAAFKLAGLTQSSSEFREFGPKRDIVDDSCDGTVNGKPCTVCHGTKDNPTPAFTLKKYSKNNTVNGVADGVSEQALWAYLGLIDYIDEDNEPFYDDDIDMDEDLQQFARPATENTPLFNGFIATFKIFCEETFKEVEVVVGVDDEGNQKKEKRPVFDGEQAVLGVKFNGKVFFANRFAALDDVFDGSDGIVERDVDAKFGFRLVGDLWDDIWGELRKKADNLSFVKSVNTVKFIDGNDDEDIIFQAGKHRFGDGPVCFLPEGDAVLSNKVDLIKAITADMSDEEKFKGVFPEEIFAGAAGCAFDGGTLIHRVPAMAKDVYDEHFVSPWLFSRFDSTEDYENVDFGNCYGENVQTNGVDVKVWKTEDAARAAAMAATPEYTLKRKVVNIVMWAEMIDPAFSCVSAAQSLTENDVPYPRSAIPSHIGFCSSGDQEEGIWQYFATSRPKGTIGGFQSFGSNSNEDAPNAELFFSRMNAIRRGNVASSGKDDGVPSGYDNGSYGERVFNNLVRNFREDEVNGLGYFYFDAPTADNNDRIPGFSIFQRYLLTDSDFVKSFPGFRDGIYRRVDDDGNGHLHVDSFTDQFNSLHVRNDGLDSVGELGYLPIAPYATIRLFGFSGEGPKRESRSDRDREDGFWGWGIATVNDEENRYISLFNSLPYRGNNRLYNRPFHRVLDYFSATNRPMRGLININGANANAVASVFNGTRLDDFLYEDIEDGDPKAAIDEDNASGLFLQSIENAFIKRYNNSSSSFADDSRNPEGEAKHLSDIGWLYDCSDDLSTDLGEFFSNDLARVDPLLDSNNAREAVIRNTCGLFTDRGLNFSILIRGEAFTPFLGRSDVRSEKGTTLASRSAFAQLWRDTEPDEDGNYPYFIQYFKIFDE